MAAQTLNIIIEEEVPYIIEIQPQGEVGPQGPTGSGVQGPAGPTGASGTNFSPDAWGSFANRSLYDGEDEGFFYFSTTGSGYIRTTATSGTWSDGIPILQGPQGEQGPIGIQGPAGPSGIQGVQGIQGPAGISGAVGPTGTTGATGPQGPSGTLGPAVDGRYQIPNGVTGGSVYFDSSMPHSNYSLAACVVYHGSGTNRQYWVTPYGLTTSGFNYDLSGTTDNTD